MPSACSRTRTRSSGCSTPTAISSTIACSPKSPTCSPTRARGSRSASAAAIGKANIHRFLHEVLGGGRWGLAANEVINHVQQQLLITVDEDRLHARARGRAEVQGNSPPDTPQLLFADGIYENDYVKEGGSWKIEGIRVTMTFYAALERAKIWFASAPPSESIPPDVQSEPGIERLGRPFNRFRWPHPVTGEPLPVPVSEPGTTDKGGGGIDQVIAR